MELLPLSDLLIAFMSILCIQIGVTSLHDSPIAFVNKVIKIMSLFLSDPTIVSVDKLELLPLNNSCIA